MNRQLTALVASLSLLVAAPAAAEAADRYASPNPSPGAECTQDDPCGIIEAVNGASVNDDITLAPGEYGTASDPLEAVIKLQGADMELRGTEGQPRPVIHSSYGTAIWVASGHVRDLEVRHYGTGTGLGLYHPDATADRVRVTSSGYRACSLYGTLRNAVCLNTRSATPFPGVAAEIQMGNGEVGVARLRNVTAIATGIESTGIRAHSFSGNGDATLRATNVIARGASIDVRIRTDTAAGKALLHAVNSNYEESLTTGPGTEDFTHNGAQNAAPLFVDADAGDFRQLPGSPTIDGGVIDPANGLFDFEGDDRNSGGIPDIGADEFVPAATSQPVPAGGGSGKPGKPAASGKPAAGPPSNRFRIVGFRRTGKGGAGLLRVKVPGPGSLSVRGASARRVTAASTGTVKVRIKPAGKAKRKLRKRGRVALRLRVSYTPRGGTARTLSKRVRLALNRR